MAAVCMSQYDTQLSAVRVRTVGTINYACMESAPTSPVSWRGLWWRAQALLVYRNAAIQLPNRPYLSRPRGGDTMGGGEGGGVGARDPRACKGTCFRRSICTHFIHIQKCKRTDIHTSRDPGLCTHTHAHAHRKSLHTCIIALQ